MERRRCGLLNNYSNILLSWWCWLFLVQAVPVLLLNILVQDKSGPGVEIILFLEEALKYIFNMYWFQLEKKYFPSTRINRSQIRWNSLATCFRIFSGTIYNVPVLFSWFPGLVYIVFASDTQNMTRPFRNRGKRYLSVYICVSTFDRTGLFETPCLFSSSFSKKFECYYWTLPPALSPAKKPWERRWDKSTTLLCLGSKLADFLSHTAF